MRAEALATQMFDRKGSFQQQDPGDILDSEGISQESSHELVVLLHRLPGHPIHVLATSPPLSFDARCAYEVHNEYGLWRQSSYSQDAAGSARAHRSPHH